MKKTLKILLISTIMLMILTVVSNAFTMQANVDKATIKVGEEVVYTIKLDEKVVATNFNINYNSASFELVGSNTQGLNVAEKNGKVAAIYADLSGVGTDQLSIKFKAKAEITNAEFSIEDAKFRGVDKDTSYVGESIAGLNNKTNITIQKITNADDGKEEDGKKDNTTSVDKLPNTGVGIGLALIIVLILFGMVNQKIKLKNLKDIVPVILGILVVTSLTTVRAEGVNISEGYTHIELSKDDSDRKITKQELMSKNTSITSIKNKEGQELQATDIVKTGYEITTAEGTSKAILYGDANGDGIVCDTDDIMVIIDTYLGKITPDEITKKAANLCNTDDVLDTDDIMQMMNMYLGNLEGTLVTNPINNNTTTDNPSDNPSDTPQENQTQKLVDVAKFGDLVNYSVGNNLEWRVWKNDGTNVMIMPTRVNSKFDYMQAKWFIAVEKEINENTTFDAAEAGFSAENRDKMNAAFNTLKNYINTTYADKLIFPKQTEYENYKNNPNDIFNNYFKGLYWLDRGYAIESEATNETDIDLRPVIVLKGDIKTTGQGENGWKLVTNNDEGETVTNHKISVEVYNKDTQQPILGFSIGCPSNNGIINMLQVYDTYTTSINLPDVTPSATKQVVLKVENGTITLQVTYDAKQKITNVQVVSADINYSIESFNENTIKIKAYV